MLPIVNTVDRPNKVTGQKNLDYHLDMGRFYLGSVDRSKYDNFLVRSLTKWSFYKGYQWIFDEDLEPFLMDESGETRSRIRFIENIIEPIVRSYVNNAIRISYNYTVEAINPFAVSRREVALEKLLAFHEASVDAGEPYLSFVRQNFNVGETPGDTERMFEDSFTDDYVEAMNYLMKDISKKNSLDDLKVMLARYLAVDGICVCRDTEYRGGQRFTVIQPQSFVWDTSAMNPTLSDGDFMGHVDMALPVEIYEQVPTLKQYQKNAIEEQVRDNASFSWPFMAKYVQQRAGRIPVINMEWKDTERQEWGWVPDITGRPVFLRVNYKGGRYKSTDCVKPERKELATELNGDNVMVRYPVVIRYCRFIPSECLKSPDRKDIVLGWGIVPYTDTEQISFNDNPFTYKVCCYEYADGEIFSPIDPVLDPQRLVNRINSNAEAMINNSRGSGTIIDDSAVDPNGGQEEVIRSMNLGKPVFLQANGQVNNVVGQYSGTASPTINILYEAKNLYAETVRNNLGINDAMTGTIGGKRELLGVTNSMIERGSLMQEGFYYTLGNCIKQMYDSMLSRGKSMYVRNDTAIYHAVGDKYTRMIKLTNNVLLEQFRCYVERTTPETDQKLIASTLALQLFQLGLIDQVRFGNVFNRGDTNDVLRMMRDSIREREAAQQEMAKAQRGMMMEASNKQEQDDAEERQIPVEVAKVNQQGAITRDLIKGEK